MDPFPGSIEIAKQYTSAEIRAGDTNQEEWPFERAKFDAITCFDVVEHLEEPGIFFKKAARYLAPGGIVVISTPNKSPPSFCMVLRLAGVREGEKGEIQANATC